MSAPPFDERAEFAAVRSLLKVALVETAAVASRLEQMEKALIALGLLKSADMVAHRRLALSVAGACEELQDIAERVRRIESQPTPVSLSSFIEPSQAAEILAAWHQPRAEGAWLQ